MFWCLSLLLLLSTHTGGEEVLIAPISINGVRGEVKFYQAEATDHVHITVNLSITGTFKWEIHKFPIIYGSLRGCEDNIIGPLYETNGDLSSRLGQLTFTGEVKNITDDKLKLKGVTSILGRSILFQKIDTNLKFCSTITSSFSIKTAIAKFMSPVRGDIIFRQVEGSAEANIYTDLSYIDGNTQLNTPSWRILVATKLDDTRDLLFDDCKKLVLLYDPDEIDDSLCSSTNHKNCKMGNLYRKHGNIVIGKTHSSSRMAFMDTNLPLEGMSIGYSLFVVIDLQDGRRSCGEIRYLSPKSAKATFSQRNLKGSFIFEQKSPFDPTSIKINLAASSDTRAVENIYILQFPILSRLKAEDLPCSSFKMEYIWNPFNIDRNLNSSLNFKTEDQYAIGHLSGRLNISFSGSVYSSSFTDYNLPLFGLNNIMGRSLFLKSNIVYCTNIINNKPLITARAIFYTPVVGYIYLRQEKDDPNSETSIFIYLSYSDGSPSSSDHEFKIHMHRIGNDFYKYKDACVSVGESYNPYNVQNNMNCNPSNSYNCPMGDLSGKHGRINISYSKNSNNSRHFFIDSEIALSGPMSIIGKSLVIYKQSNIRLACGDINVFHPIRAIAKEWTNFEIKGQSRFEQSTLFDPTQSFIDISNLNETAGGYHIHELSVPLSFDNPCSGGAVLDHYNPFGVNPKESPPPTVGSDDLYELGDLSGKYGRMTGMNSFKATYQDSILPLQGPYSIIGRSFLIHKEEKNERWICATVEYDTKSYINASVIYARAVFEEMFVSGYITMMQLVFGDGTYSDTTIEVNLTHAGNRSNETTHNHIWGMMVQAIGRDNLLEDSSYRCLSGGGLNNQFYSKMSSDYITECSVVEPLRCQFGDISGRTELLSIGKSQRKIFTDVNSPLTGNFSILGKAVIIYDENKSSTTLACANLEPETQVFGIYRIQIGKKFKEKSFLKYARQALKADEWMITIVSVKSKNLYNGLCKELVVHFKGPNAYEMKETVRRMLKVKDKKIGFHECTSQLISKMMSSSSLLSASGFLYMFVIILVIIQRVMLYVSR